VDIWSDEMNRFFRLHLRRTTTVKRYRPRERWEPTSSSRYGSCRRAKRKWDQRNFNESQAESATNWVRTGYAHLRTWYEEDGQNYQEALAVRLDAERAVDLAFFRYPPTYAVQRFACVDDEPGDIVAVWLLSEPRPKRRSDACARKLARELGGHVTTEIPVGGAIGSLPRIESYPSYTPGSFRFRFAEVTGRPYRRIYINRRYAWDTAGALLMEAAE
jgi:hypothetical protein